MFIKSLTFIIMLVAQVVMSYAAPLSRGDVLFCQEIENVGWSFEDKKLTKYRLNPFKIFIESENDILLKGGSLDGISMQVEYFLTAKIVAKTTFSTMVLNEREFIYSLALESQGVLISAECDVF